MMRKLVVGALLLTGLYGCSGDDAPKPTPGSTGGSGAGAAGTPGAGSGMGGSNAAGSGSGGGGQTAGGSGSADWPTYEEAEAAAQSTPLLLLLLDFADSDLNATVPNAEAAWSKMMFGREQSNGNHYWYQASAGRFQTLPAAETGLTPNNGAVHVKVTAPRPTGTTPQIAEDQPWLTEALDLSAQYVNYASFDSSGDGVLTNDELSVLMIINWEGDVVALAPAQANIDLSHPIAGAGVTLEKFARVLYIHSAIGIPMHELGHHVFSWDHTPGPTDHDVMGQGAYWPDPMISTLHEPLSANATRPTLPKGMHRLRSGWVEATELTGSMQGVQLHAAELGKQANLIKLPVAQGFLLLENRTAWGYDQSIPFCAGEAGALFVDEVGQYLSPLNLTLDYAPPTTPDVTKPATTLCDVYALQGHNDSFTFGGWRISNVSAPGPIMTLDIEKLDVVSAVDHYRFVGYFDEAGARVRHEKRLDGAASTIDYSTLHGGDSRSGFVSIGINAYYTTGEVRSTALETTYTSSAPYLTFANAGEFQNGGAPTPDSLTYATFHADETPVASVDVNFKTGTLDHTITFTNLPQN